MLASDTDKVLPIRIVVDYAPVKGKRSVCHLSSCNKVIERGHLRVKEEYTTPPIEGGEAALKYHIECYSAAIDMSKVEGLDKLKEEDKEIILSKATNTSAPESQDKGENKVEEDKEDKSEEAEAKTTTTTTTTTTENNKKEKDNEKENEKEIEKENEKETEANEEKQKEVEEKEKEEKEEVKDKEKEKPQQAPTYRNGAKVVAKVHANCSSKKIWFAAKILNSRLNTLGLREYHVSYTDEQVKDLKEWVAEKFVAPPVNPDSPSSSSSLVPGTLALGWRRKPGGQEGWWYSVKVLRYLSDVPGAYVSWPDFPFPDSILESGKVFPLIKTGEPQQTGVKRQLGESESDTLAKKEKVT